MSATLLPPSLIQPAIGDGSFAPGTPIAVPSPDGAPTERAVESLARGDLVLTLSGPAPVRHVAATRQEGTDPPRQRLVPVRVAAGAFGEGQPVADLLLPPEQLVHVMESSLPGGALVPLGALVNGTTIRREPQPGPTPWLRLELEQPGVVIAAGLLVAARLDPAAQPPAPLLPAGPATVALRARLARPQPPTDQDPPPPPPPHPPAPAPTPPQDPPAEPPPGGHPTPAQQAPEAQAAPEQPAEPAPAPAPSVDRGPALRIVVKGETLPAEDGGEEYALTVMLPAGASIVRLLSPRGLPANTTGAERDSARRFGIAIRAILIDDAPLPLDGPAIGDGFHGLESAGGESWRWTNGEAVLHLPPSQARRQLAVLFNNWHQLLQPE